MKDEQKINKKLINEERRSLVVRLEDWLETPMLVLGFVWLGLLVYEFIWNLSPALELLGTIIWIIFILDFAVKFLLTPDKTDYFEEIKTSSSLVGVSGEDEVNETFVIRSDDNQYISKIVFASDKSNTVVYTFEPHRKLTRYHYIIALRLGSYSARQAIDDLIIEIEAGKECSAAEFERRLFPRMENRRGHFKFVPAR
jgi:hypothetical protein